MKDFIINLQTKDGSLIQNRSADRRMYFSDSGALDKQFVDFCLTKDCQQKGVKLISYTHDNQGVYGIVDYL